MSGRAQEKKKTKAPISAVFIGPESQRQICVIFLFRDRENNAKNDKLMKSMEKMIQIKQSRNYIPGGEAIANFHPADILYKGNPFHKSFGNFMLIKNY